MDKEKRNKAPYLPLLFALLLLTGIFIGTRIPGSEKRSVLLSGRGQYNRIFDLISYIKENYVDTVNDQQLYEAAIQGLIQDLDPHSSYIPAADFHEVTDPLKGNFEGIGIQFRIVSDSIVVLNTIPGGPSDKAGIRAGDRIIAVDGRPVAGKKITNEDVTKYLKGPKGSTVNVGIFRRGVSRMMSFTLTRDVIPTFSVDAAYLIDADVAYVKVSRFSSTTGKEVQEAMISLKDQGMKSLILDLRGNTGGYLQSAIDLTKEFLPEKAMIVYTMGRKRPRQSFYADGSGLFQKGKLVVLIDEGSASASEILAGAIQDNDRGTIIGRRSFGKGLVQEEVDLKDGSALRLTVARYYTPSGRCIQKPYNRNHEEYSMEAMKRYLNGEMENPDSIRFNDSLKYKTLKGRTVYGGGGIMPDVYLPLEKNEQLKLFNKLANSDLLYQYAFTYTDHNRQALAKYRDYRDFDKEFSVDGALLNEFFAFAEKNGIDVKKELTPASEQEIKAYLKSLIARNIFDDKGFYPIFNKTDRTLRKAVELILQ